MDRARAAVPADVLEGWPPLGKSDVPFALALAHMQARPTTRYRAVRLEHERELQYYWDRSREELRFLALEHFGGRYDGPSELSRDELRSATWSRSA